MKPFLFYETRFHKIVHSGSLPKIREEKVVGMATAISTDNHLHGRTSDAIRRLRTIERRLSSVTSGICGHRPESAGDIAKPVDEHLHEKLDSVSRLLAEIEEEMCRLENAVGSSQQIGQAKAAASY